MDISPNFSRQSNKSQKSHVSMDISPNFSRENTRKTPLYRKEKNKTRLSLSSRNRNRDRNRKKSNTKRISATKRQMTFRNKRQNYVV